MKRIVYFLGLIFILIFFENCCRSEDPVCNLENGLGPNIEIVKDEMIIQIPQELFDGDYKKLNAIENDILNDMGLTRKQVKVEYCPCGDGSIQKWKFDPNLATEGSVTAMKDKEGSSNVEGDLQFLIKLPKEGDGLMVKASDSMPPFRNQEIKGIGIAVLDTGMDLRLIDEERLFPIPDLNSCGKGNYGWNFVENTNNIQDDHNEVGHGTVVSTMITNSLARDGIEHQILPLKIFDKNGEGSYWNIVCAMSFIVEINNNIEDSNHKIKIVNASFGGTLGAIPESHLSVLKQNIDKLEQDAVVITSAGNCHFNTDCPKTSHYPSGYSSKNILAVGGFDKSTGQYLLHSESNYGKQNIDLATPFNHKLDITLGTDQLQLSLPGTSYSTAYNSYLYARVYDQLYQTGAPASQMKNDFLAGHTGGMAQGLDGYIANSRYAD